ncbi:MAG: hypothetical protein M3N31_07490 [Actinomycetota bacterium]|nr:hypothetical protein [Actinomycetota bacterium]
MDEGTSGGQAASSTSRRDRPGLAIRFLRMRMPVWLALTLLVAVAGAFAALLVAQQPADLGPAARGALDAQVSVTMCNEKVDQGEINPRTAELDFEEGLKELGTRTAKVRVSRIDCPDAPKPKEQRPSG